MDNFEIRLQPEITFVHKNIFLHLMLMMTFSVLLVDIHLSSFHALALLREAFPVLDVVALLDRHLFTVAVSN